MSKTKLIKEFPPGVKVVSMIAYKDRVLLATEGGLYELTEDKFGPVLEPVPIKYEETKVYGGLIHCNYCPDMHPIGYMCPKRPKGGLDNGT